MKQFIISVSFFMLSLPLAAEICIDCTFIANDSLYLSKAEKFGMNLDKISSSRIYRMMFIGVPLIAGGIIVKGEDDHFRSLRNDYLPQFNRHFDDYLQYAPATVMLGMKTYGIEGRSSWKRMLVSDAFSAILMGSAVNTLKQTTQVERPDGSNKHSFPSGHTATAFMTATMLTKEYQHKSPWIGIGAYTVASATGLMRVVNNKHWLSDILAGAGIGILSTEFGYYLADLLFKEKGIKRFADDNDISRTDKPSFLSLYLGLNIQLSDYDLDSQTALRASSGSTAGIEGACFINPYIGFGGRLAVSNTSIIVNKSNAEDNTFDVISLSGGAYFSYPLSLHWLIGSKLLGGFVHYPRLKLSEQTVQEREGFCAGSGVSFTYRATDHYGIRFFMDYNLLPSHSRNSKEWMNTLTAGASFAVTF